MIIKKLALKFYRKINPCSCRTLWCPADDAAHRIHLSKVAPRIAQVVCDKHEAYIVGEF